MFICCYQLIEVICGWSLLYAHEDGLYYLPIEKKTLQNTQWVVKLLYFHTSIPYLQYIKIRKLMFSQPELQSNTPRVVVTRSIQDWCSGYVFPDDEKKCIDIISSSHFTIFIINVPHVIITSLLIYCVEAQNRKIFIFQQR